MAHLPEELTENGIHYTLHGDYYLPDLTLPEAPKQPIGRYGRMRKAYLEEHRPGLYERLVLDTSGRHPAAFRSGGRYRSGRHPDRRVPLFPQPRLT